MYRTARIALGFLLVFWLAGCAAAGGQSDGVASLGGSSTASAPAGGTGQSQDTSEHDALVKYAECMRQHGVNMADPVAGGVLQAPISAANDPAGQQKLQDAQQACASRLPNGGQPSAADLERRTKFAQCMRQHGVHMPDPTNNGQALTLNLSDPGTKAALTACSPATAAGTTTGGTSSGG